MKTMGDFSRAHNVDSRVIDTVYARTTSSTVSRSMCFPTSPFASQPTMLIATLLLCSAMLVACGSTPAITTPEITTPTQEETISTEDGGEGSGEGSGETAEEEPQVAEPDLPTFDPNSVEIALQPLIQNLSRPVFVTSANDGSNRLFIIEQPGVIRLAVDGALSETPFLDIRERVGDSGNEQGLLGLAFAPNFSETGHLYVNYTGLNGATVVSRFNVAGDNPNAADPNTEFVILTIPQPAQNHNGGMVTFGPDGYLYIGTGDGGAANDRFENGQNPASLLGKMLRIDVTSDPSQPYLIPQDNPWVANDWTIDGEAVDVLDEIWAVGLRNPWRYSFDRLTNDLWIADVGQNKLEEVNFVTASLLDSAGAGMITPLNFGWPIMEASECFSVVGGCDSTGLVLPVGEYGHSGHCSVTGGHVYRGQTYPALQGAYIYGDFCSGVIWALASDGNGGWTNTEVLKSGQSISSFGEDEQGELYMTTLGGGVYQITATEKVAGN